MQAFLMDAIIVAAFVITVAIFTYRGLAKSAMGFLVILASFIVCKIFGGPVGNWINTTFIFDGIASSVNALLSNTVGDTVGSINGAELFENIPNAIKNILDFAGADMASIEDYMVNFRGNVEEGLAEMSRTIAAPIASAISTVIAYLILFVGSFIAFKLLSIVLLKVLEIPVLSAINRIGGCILGIVSGFIFCWLGVKIFSLIVGILALKSPELSEFANASDAIIYSFFAGL